MITGRLLRSSARVAALTLFLVLALALTASAQARVRVTADHVNIWRPGFSIVATVVNSGTVLEVVRRSGDWYEVIVPGPEWQPEQTGFISVTRVEPIDGTQAPPPAPRAQRPSGQTPRPATRPASGPAARVRTPSPWKGFVQFGYGRFTAHQTFDAVLGSPLAPWFGGGVRYAHRSGLFVDGSVEHTQSTGERVFVSDGAVYRLGIEDKVFITPLMATAGYRAPIGRAAAYAGAGAGAYIYRETSKFAEDNENVAQTNAAYRGVAGFEWTINPSYGFGLEFQYTSVPDALTGGAAAALNESNLGGMHVVARIVFGR